MAYANDFEYYIHISLTGIRGPLVGKIPPRRGDAPGSPWETEAAMDYYVSSFADTIWSGLLQEPLVQVFKGPANQSSSPTLFYTAIEH